MQKNELLFQGDSIEDYLDEGRDLLEKAEAQLRKINGTYSLIRHAAKNDFSAR